MTNTELIEAVKAGDESTVVRLLDAGQDVNANGNEQEWTALNFAAGAGNLPMISLLLQRGANVFAVGRDNRTPYNIALAAGHIEACRLLSEAEQAAGGDTKRISSRAYETRPYCKAYALSKLRQFPNWTETWPSSKGHDKSDKPDEAPTDQTIVFIHQDYTVTKSEPRCGFRQPNGFVEIVLQGKLEFPSAS
jgi:uncharacterized protein